MFMPCERTVVLVTEVGSRCTSCDFEAVFSLYLYSRTTHFSISFLDPVAQRWYPGKDNIEAEGWVLVARQDKQSSNDRQGSR